ncbi:Imidazole glycerol phosphate synthase subunit HisF [Planctomycetes bacterium Pla163]|uniref:imidazole glycerol-phosphate synthase n=1 Tax=Rohdeia mirabilis TaxID=2528008 RepID=A0A518D2I8_9BACT|nr:Imidazole glycerol phosphate synthase subunit HisF [Planctomycetes bacterium Pla163]
MSAAPSLGACVRVIPCLDVRGGRVVKGVRFRDLADAGDPAELAARYQSEGADELCLLDVSATLDERGACAATVESVRAVLSIPLTVGGGVRTLADAKRLLAAGADKVSVNSAAVLRPELVTEISRAFGSQAAVVAVDAERVADGAWRVTVRSGSTATQRCALDWIAEATRRGAGEILLTAVERDGTGAGFDLELLRAARAVTCVPIVASGGARSARDLVRAARCGATGLLAAGMFHRGEVSIAAAKLELAAAGRKVRP